MYIKKVDINNVRSIREFEMEFRELAGWHVLIGDNGAGKSSIIRSISLGLIGLEGAFALRESWSNWLSFGQEQGNINLFIDRDMDYDVRTGFEGDRVHSHVGFRKREEDHIALFFRTNNNYFNSDDDNFGSDRYLMDLDGWFSVAFGPYRRFAGGNPDKAKIFQEKNKLGAHLSAFGEDVALVEATEWLVKLYFQSLEDQANGRAESAELIECFKKLINSPDFLPHGAKLDSISSSGVKFRDGYGNLIDIQQMSDGYRSILSLTFELIRQMIITYGADEVFREIEKGNIIIDLPGVVLVDEIDAHLHPTWQTRIGQWFTKYFPKIQFIVTTHSPLVCRAATKGSIWRLTSPGSDLHSGEVTGLEKDRLVLGNVLDAYGTEIFGTGVSIAKEADDKLNRLAELNIKSMMGKLGDSELDELQHLKAIFPTERPGHP